MSTHGGKLEDYPDHEKTRMHLDPKWKLRVTIDVMSWVGTCATAMHYKADARTCDIPFIDDEGGQRTCWDEPMKYKSGYITGMDYANFLRNPEHETRLLRLQKWGFVHADLPEFEFTYDEKKENYRFLSAARANEYAEFLRDRVFTDRCEISLELWEESEDDWPSLAATYGNSYSDEFDDDELEDEDE